MKKLAKLIKSKWAGYTIVICIAIIFHTILNNLSGILEFISSFMIFIHPVFNGVMIAYVLNPLCSFFEKRLFKRILNRTTGWILSVITSIIIIFCVIILLGAALIPQLAESVSTLFSNMQDYISAFRIFLKKITDTSAGKHLGINPDQIFGIGDGMIEKAGNYVTDHMGLFVGKSADIGKWLIEAVISFILAIYFLIDKRKIKISCKEFLFLIMGEDKYKKALTFLTRCNNITFKFISIDVIDAIIIGFANFIFMLLTGMNYAALVSVIVGITNLAPTFGPLIGAVIGAFVLVFTNPWHAFWFLVFTAILQTVDGYLLKPKLFGNSLGVSSLMIMIAIILGGRLFGVMGVLLAIPVSAILDFMWKDFVITSLKEYRNKRKSQINDQLLDSDPDTEIIVNESQNQ